MGTDDKRVVRGGAGHHADEVGLTPKEDETARDPSIHRRLGKRCQWVASQEWIGRIAWRRRRSGVTGDTTRKVYNHDPIIVGEWIAIHSTPYITSYHFSISIH